MHMQSGNCHGRRLPRKTRLLSSQQPCDVLGGLRVR